MIFNNVKNFYGEFLKVTSEPFTNDEYYIIAKWL